MKKNKKIVVFTGAGVSAESGIPTFRDSNGIWTKYNPDVVASMKGWFENPQEVLDFHYDAKTEMEKCKPNPAHIAIAELEGKYDVTVVTQNIDNLHEEGGSTNVLHLHGRINQARSSAFPELIYDLAKGEGIKLGDLCEKNYQKRYNTVLFGDQLPIETVNKSLRAIRTADILILVGCSLKVQPAASLVEYFGGEKIYIINPGVMEDKIYHTVEYIKEPAIKGMLQLMKKLV